MFLYSLKLWTLKIIVSTFFYLSSAITGIALFYEFYFGILLETSLMFMYLGILLVSLQIAKICLMKFTKYLIW